MSYKKDTDYQKLINDAVSKGDYASASKYETERNNKIDSEGLSYAKTYNYQKPNGVSDKSYNQYNQNFSVSNDTNNKLSETSNAATNYKNVAGEKIVSDKTNKALNKTFITPSAVAEADAWLSNQLSIIQSGKTTYSDDVRAMMDKIANREKFTYDVDTDPLFQQALASATNSGKQAMQDTIGQASALTGGYGSTYATSVGNQTYNSFIEDAYDQLPQYYQMALESYQMEGDEMYRQLGMYSDADDREYNRNIAAYDATFNMRNRQYDEAYGKFRDDKSDAFNMANLEVNLHGQKVNDAYNLYNIAKSESDTAYEREYIRWQDSINQAYQMMQMENSDWWNQTNFDENVRQYEKTYAQNEDHFTRNMAFEDKWNQKNMDFQASENAKDRAVKSSSSVKSGGFDLSGFVTEEEAKKTMEKVGNSQAVNSFKSSVLTESEFTRRGKKASFNGESRRFDTYEQYIEAKIEDKYKNGKGTLTEMETAYLLAYYGLGE